MTVRVKYWPKDKSFTVTDHEHPGNKNVKILYDGRSEEYKKWLKQTNVLWTWSQRSVVVHMDKGEERRAVVYSLFNFSKGFDIK